MAIGLDALPWYGQVGIFAALAVAGSGAFYNVYDRPTEVAMQARRGELAHVQADIQRGRDASQRLPKVRQEVDALDARLTDLRAVLPEEKDAADLLRQLQLLATQSNLAITSFTPAPAVIRELHAEWPMSLELQGSYHNLGLFLDRLSTLARIVNISELTLKGRGAVSPDATIDASFVATTFVLVDTSASTVPDKKAD
ncbi:MAG: type 4a pilus biogenesis protein PilO [Acidobacteriaceae bacterium]|jgi:type IV pilus assembly protein PilO|nr:type 4a pilus biogenesis protein PilO [Acidobacteriaceae bacterium]